MLAKTRIIYCAIFMTLTIAFSGCKKYLDVKPDQKMALPATLKDLQELLDNYEEMNAGYPGLGEETTDNWTLSDEDWLSLDLDDRDNYCFLNNNTNNGRWSSSYKVVFYSNQVLDGLSRIEEPSGKAYNRSYIEGAAHFFRAYAYYQLAQVFTEYYDPDVNGTLPGLVLRKDISIDEHLKRATLSETYETILSDLKIACRLLPEIPSVPSRPGKGAAYTMLARNFLIMGNYAESLAYTDSALFLHDSLMNYNSLNSAANNPFGLFNPEVVLDSKMGTQLMRPAIATVLPNFYDSYDEYDLRKKLFFRKNKNGTYRFKGSYDGINSSSLFNGISSAELYLMKAEALARLGEPGNALVTLNALLKTRWAIDHFVPYQLSGAPDVLTAVLLERRKELPFRGLRWPDLRRLAKEGIFNEMLQRNIDGHVYILSPQKIPTYAYFIPELAITNGGYEQNKRE